MGAHYILDTFQGNNGDGMDIHVSDSGNTWDSDGLGAACQLNGIGGVVFFNGFANSVDICTDFGYPANGAWQADLLIGDTNTTLKLYVGTTAINARDAHLRLSNLPVAGFEIAYNATGVVISHVTGFLADGPTVIYTNGAETLNPGNYPVLFTPDGTLTFNGHILATGLSAPFEDLFYFGTTSGNNAVNYLQKIQAGQWDGTKIINPDAPPAPAPAPSGGSSASDPQWAKFRTDLVNHRWKY